LCEPLISKTIEVYVDDMTMKSKTDVDHRQNFQKAFDILRAFSMKLNPKKCVFRVRLAKFLGFIISSREIEANLNKL